MSLPYVRQRYGVPAKRGGRVRFRGREGTVVGAGARPFCDSPVRLIVRINDLECMLHPADDRLEYLDDEGCVVWPDAVEYWSDIDMAYEEAPSE